MPNLFFNDAHGYYEQGKDAVEKGRLEDALEAFRSSVGLEPSVEALIGLGIVAMMLEPESDEGFNALEHARDLAPDDERVVAALGGAYLAHGEYEAAVAFLREQVSRNPRQLSSLLMLAEAYADNGQPKLAEKTIKQALQLAPAQPEVHIAACRFWQQEHKLDKAFQEAQQAVHLAPEDPQAHLMLGSVLAAQERYAEALPEIQVMLDADPEYAPAQVTKGMLLYHLGQQDEALALLHQVEHTNDDIPDLLHGIALFYFGVNKLPEAKALVLQEIALDPDFQGAYELLYQIAGAMGDSATMQEAHQGLRRTGSPYALDIMREMMMGVSGGRAAKSAAKKSAGGTGRKKKGNVEAIYQLKVTLKGVRPPVWRRVLVPDTITLADLHRIIQAVMGWSDCHLHEFTAGTSHYGIPDQEDVFFGDYKEDERKIAFSDIAQEVKKLCYSYDFGDGWEHDILIEKVLPPDPALNTPVCLKCKRACPPEDVGGPWGYADFLEAIEDPTHESHEEMVEWIGGTFDPEACDLDEINARLAKIKV